MSQLGDTLRQAATDVDAALAAKDAQIATLTQQLADCEGAPTPDIPVTATVSSTGVVNVAPDAGATVVIKNSGGQTVYSGGDGGGGFASGAYTWTATAAAGYVLTSPATGTFSIAAVPPPPTGGDIPPGTEVTAAALNAALLNGANGQIFRVRGSTGATGTLVPRKPGQQIWGLEGPDYASGKMPYFDGQNQAIHGLEGPGGESNKLADIVVAYIDFRNFHPTDQNQVNMVMNSTNSQTLRRKAAVRGKTFQNLRTKGLYVHDCGTGVDAGPGMVWEGGLFDYCHHLFLKASKVSFQMKGGWEAKRSNLRKDGRMYFEMGFEVGVKLTNCADVLIEDGFSHHNNGAGMWSDGNENIRHIYRRLRCEDNAAQGIHYELSQTGQFIDCTTARNAGAGDLYISNSAGTSGTPIIVKGGRFGPHDDVGVKAAIALKDNPGRSPRIANIRIEDAVVHVAPGGRGIHLFGGGYTTKPASVVAVNCKDQNGNAVNITVGG